ncbi:MAG: response regulator [Methylotenera sp.]|nr:response regulator [Methylotenera sp.]MDP1960374.1 response regulator [Methylotenera sp.]MDP3302847.1 response regulator [Methylotenera sp.]MDP3942335.1 response regulator [Methylotenera sp.]
MKKMLIVDDSSELRSILLLTFSYGSFEMLQAENGLQAITLAEHEKPEVIILDIMMPQMDGLEVCRKIKAIPALANSFIIILTSLDSHCDKKEALDAGADCYMTKPFNPVEILAVISNITKKSIIA